MARTESDIESLKNIFSHSAMVLLQSFLLLIGITAIILYEEPAYGLILLVLFPVMAVAVRFYLSYIMRIWTIVRRKNSFLSGYITEYIQAVPIIQLFVKKKEAVDMIVRHSVDKMKYERKANFTDYVIFWTFFQFITETVALAVIFYIGISKILKGDMSIGSLIMYTEFMRQLAMPLRNLMQVLSQIQASLAASSRVFDILDTPAKVREHAENDIIPSLRDSIEFEKIAFAYDKEDVIRNISMSIRAGEHVAIIGPSGSGKTTIINLLLRFYELEKGRILIDNTDIKGYRIENLRKRIGLVLQDVYLFPGTILDNLKAFNPDVCDESVFEASRKLGAHELIMKKSDGYATELSEGGSNLSMGERQLISFIRAMVKDPDLLILDEATSSVDVITENMLQRALSRLMEGRTAIIIAHRLSTIQNADKIIVFNNGRIEEEGSHGELMAKGGLYSRLYKIQEVKA
jgi:ATP-binding cassette subfamily B protein